MLAKTRLVLAMLLVALLPAHLLAQDSGAWTTTQSPPSQQAAQEQEHWIDVQADQSLVWRAKNPIARLLLSDPSVAEVKLLEEEQFQVRGLTVGTTDLWVW